jgi:hypothetical protein
MLTDGLDSATVMKYTGLSGDEVTNFINESIKIIQPIDNKVLTHNRFNTLNSL